MTHIHFNNNYIVKKRSPDILITVMLSSLEANVHEIKEHSSTKKNATLLPSLVDAVGVLDETETLPSLIVTATRLSMVRTSSSCTVQIIKSK